MSTPTDPLNFIPADIFFSSVPSFAQSQHVIDVESSDSVDKTDPLRYAAHITLSGAGGNQNTHCLIQFVTPQIWRIRYNPKFSGIDQYPDANS